MSARVRVAPDAGGLAASAAVFLAHAIREECARSGVCSIALAGGSTPAPVYRLLAEERLPWERVHLWLGDERCVPPSSAESNARMVREALLERLPSAPAAFHPVDGAETAPEKAAQAYGRGLPERFDLVVLGIGGDGHTASLFPGSAALDATRPVVVTEGPKPPNPRITLTPPVLRAARERVVLAAGEDKADAVARALEPNASEHEVPAALARDGVWFVDRAAAARLGARDR